MGGAAVASISVVRYTPEYAFLGLSIGRPEHRFGAVRPVSPTLAPASGLEVLPAAALPLAEVATYDRTCFEAPRDAFLCAWLTLPGHVALAARRAGRLAGYAVLRPRREGAKIGPLFADGPDDAAALLGALLDAAPARPVTLDVPEPNVAPVAPARAAGMALVFETARMYAGAPPPPMRPSRVFGITSFELG